MCDLFMKKIRRNYRQKADESDEEASTEPESLYAEALKGTCPDVGKEKPTSTCTLKKNRSILSFEDDLDPDDGDTFKLKKPSDGHKTSKHMKDVKRKKPILDDQVKIVGKLTSVPLDNDNCESPTDSEQNLENLRKQLSDLSEESKVHAEPKMESSSGNNYFTVSAIPDAATIHLARKQREKAKTLIGQSDRSPILPASTDNGEGRQIMEDDDDDDEEEEEEDFDDASVKETIQEVRPAFILSRDRHKVRPGIKSRLDCREAELKSMREKFLAAEHASDRDDDQETEWERQQLQKAMINQNSAALEAIQPLASHLESEKNGSEHHALASMKIEDITLAKLKYRLQARYDELNSNLIEHQTALTDARSDLETGKRLIKESSEKLPNLAKSLLFYQEMKAYVDDLISCFNEKISKIEYLEKRTLSLYNERFKKLVERRRLDMKDLADAIPQSNATTTNQSATNKSAEDSKIVEARRRRCAERDSRRLRRQRARELRTVGVAQLHVDGTSTDDEEPQAVIAKRQSDLESLLVDANALFEDVVDEFCLLPLIIKHFAEWRIKSPNSYKEAYVALCLPQLFSPIVRLQLIGWNPLISSCAHLENMSWFQDLMEFCCLPALTKSESSVADFSKTNVTTCDSTNEIDDNIKVIPAVVEKIILQRLNDIITCSWDPLSETESNRLVAFVDQLCNYYPTVRVGSRTTEQLFATIVKRIENTIQEDIFIPLYSKEILKNRQSASFQFFERQFNIGLKLLKNILLWQDLLNPEAMKHVTLTCLVNRYLLVGLACLVNTATVSTSAPSHSVDDKPQQQHKSSVKLVKVDEFATLTFCDTINYLRTILDLLPKSWMKADKIESDASVDNARDPLKQLKRFITQLMEQRVVGGENLEREWTNTLNYFSGLL